MPTITIGGGFHQTRSLTLRVGDSLSAGQYKKLQRRMCGVQGCICGWRGFDLEGMERAAFLRMVEDAAYAAWLKRSL